MRRLSAILVLLAVAFLSSAPAWALVVADHSCCSAAKVSPRQVEKFSGKHAHCAAMAAKIAAEPPKSDGVSAVHRCELCNLSVLTRPQSTLGVRASASIARVSEIAEPTAVAFSAVLGERVVHLQRGPPSFLS